MPMVLQEATQIHVTVNVSRHQVLLSFQTHPVRQTSGLTNHTLRDNTMKNQKLQEAICQAIVFAPNFAHPSLQTEGAQSMKRLLVTPLRTPLLRHDHTPQCEQKLFHQPLDVNNEKTFRPTASGHVHFLCEGFPPPPSQEPLRTCQLPRNVFSEASLHFRQQSIHNIAV
jgi:hypothetical protein